MDILADQCHRWENVTLALDLELLECFGIVKGYLHALCRMYTQHRAYEVDLTFRILMLFKQHLDWRKYEFVVFAFPSFHLLSYEDAQCLSSLQARS